MSSTLAIIGSPFIPGWDQLGASLPELVLVAAIVGVLITPFFTERRNFACAVVALVGLVGAFVLVFAVAGEDGAYFRGLLVSDSLAVLWKGLLLLFTAGIVLMWIGTMAEAMREGDGPEFFTLLLGATLGMSLMASTTNLLMIFLVVELASLPSYVLAGFRKTHRLGAEASLKYVLFGAATSSIMVYGLSLAYGLYGTLDLAKIAEQMAVPGAQHVLLAVVLIGLIAGIGFKISAVPFHFWCPDVFEGAHVDVAAFLSVASKGAALVLLLRMVMLIGSAAGFEASAVTVSLAWTLGILGAVTATWGNLAAFAQTNIKRLLAYSSIAHAGYMVCALSLLVARRNEAPAADAAQAVILYLAVYLFMNLGAFTIAALVWRQTGSEQIADFSGLGRRAPIAAAVMTACLFSLVGLPPLAGFAAKLVLMKVLFDNGGWWTVLVFVIGINTVLSLYYYLRIVKVMYLEDRGEDVLGGPILPRVIGVACAAMLVIMLIGFGSLDRLTRDAGRIHDTNSSVAAVK